MTELYDIPLETIDGEKTSLAEFKDKAVLMVNVASKCGLTPQYTALEELHERLAPNGFTVIGFPCNQFKGQEPGSAEEIKEFCSVSYGITFPLLAKGDVNGDDRHPLYAALTSAAPSTDEHSDDIKWNFEKFLIAPDGTVTRFRPWITPDDPSLVAAVEASLPA